jgi:hypothetical protein
MIKFSFEETVKFFNQQGFFVLDEYNENIHIGDKLNIQDKYGYKYYISKHGLYSGICNSEKLGLVYNPQVFAIQNPYTVDNIILWMNNNNCSFTFHHGEYHGNDVEGLYFQCNKCNNVWNYTWDLIQRGCACPYCVGKRVSYENSLAKVRPDLIKEWNFEKNKISIEEVSPRSSKKYWWICSRCGNEWQADVRNRNALTKEMSTNCPKCCTSSGELETEKILKKYNIKFEIHKSFENCRYKNKLTFDFYLPEHNCCIEFNGKQHYENVINWKGYYTLPPERFEEQKIRDQIKKDFCLKENILFIIIPYWDINNIELILINQLKID